MSRRRQMTDRLTEAMEWAATRPVAGTVLRIVREMMSVDVRDRIFGMTGQAFMAIIPVLIIVSTAVSEKDGESIAVIVNDRLSLSGPTANTVEVLFTNPDTTVASASLISVVLLLFSLNSFTRTMRRSVERPWGLSKSGTRGQLAGLLGVVLLGGMFATVVQVGSLWPSPSPAEFVAGALLKTAVASGFWLVITYVMSTGRIPLRHLWPGALAGGIAQTGAGWWTVTFLPAILEKDTSRYGVIGAALGILTWLVVMSGVAVGVGVVGAQIARAAGWVDTPSADASLSLLNLLSPAETTEPVPTSTGTEGPTAAAGRAGP